MNTILWLVGIVGLLFVLLSVFKVWKTKRLSKSMTTVGVLMIVGGLIAAFALGPLTVSPANQAAQQPNEKTGQGMPELAVPCTIEDTTVTLAAQDKYSASATGGTHKYRVCNSEGCAPASTVSDGGTFTASPNNRLEILFQNESNSGYYGDVKEVTIPCTGTKTYFDNDAVQNGSLTTNIFNEEGNLISGTTNETLSAGDVVDLDMEIKGQYQREFPHGLLAVVEYNQSTIDDAIISLGGSEQSTTSTPESYSPGYGSDSSTVTYEIPALISNDKLTGTFTIDVDDSNDPAQVTSDINITYYAKDYFINQDMGGAFDGPAIEDEDQSVTRSVEVTKTVSVD